MKLQPPITAMATADEGLAEQGPELVSAAADLDEAERLREHIAICEAVLEPTTGERFSTVEDLFAALLK